MRDFRKSAWAASALAAAFCQHAQATPPGGVVVRYDLDISAYRRAEQTWPVRERAAAARNLAAEFRRVAADARGGRFATDDALLDGLRFSTDAVLRRTPLVRDEWHDALVDIRNRLVSFSNAGLFKDMDDWARALEEVARGLEKVK